MVAAVVRDFRILNERVDRNVAEILMWQKNNFKKKRKMCVSDKKIQENQVLLCSSFELTNSPY